MSTNHVAVIFACSEVGIPAILEDYENFTFILKNIVTCSMLLCLPDEIVAVPKGISLTKLKSNNTRTKIAAKTCTFISLLPLFALGSCRKKTYFFLLCCVFGLREKPTIS